MALSANALMTVDEAKVALGIDASDTTQNTLVETLVNEASDRMNQRTGRYLRKRRYQNEYIDGHGGKTLYFQWPVLAAPTIYLDDELQTVWFPGDSTKPADSDVIVQNGSIEPKVKLYRANGWRRGAANIKISDMYAGYWEIDPAAPATPAIARHGNLTRALSFILADWYHKRDKSRWGVVSRTIGGETTTFSQEPIPPEAERLLESFTRMDSLMGAV